MSDYGPCCKINPFLNFINPETAKLDPNTYIGKHWHSVPKGSQNGNFGGIRFLLDVESYAFAYMGKDSVGFRITFADALDKPTVTQDAYLLSPGYLKNKIHSHLVITVKNTNIKF
jgi:hypothetical protein